ncbi:MAG: hypothetical protein JW940_18335 [Polyangiaceae bacterium]|nr:hypothetical protein [Polyangiaceae bacterium]
MRSDRQDGLARVRPAPHSAGVASDEVPADLQRRFASFRRSNASRTRVPASLRKAVLDALGQGCSMLAVRRELGLTVKQIGSWQREARRAPVETEPVTGIESPRVFAVGERRATGGDADGALELRLGAWSLIIRHTCP